MKLFALTAALIFATVVSTHTLPNVSLERILMPINSKQFREYIVRPVLKALDPEIPYSSVGENLMMLTVAHESDMGTYLRQNPVGPARSVYQIERATFDWLIDYLNRPARASLKQKINSYSATGLASFEELTWNLALATCIARLRYYVDKDPLPTEAEGIKGLARYWSQNYQTTEDPVKIAEAIRDYERFVQ